MLLPQRAVSGTDLSYGATPAAVACCEKSLSPISEILGPRPYPAIPLLRQVRYWPSVWCFRRALLVVCVLLPSVWGLRAVLTWRMVLPAELSLHDRGVSFVVESGIAPTVRTIVCSYHMLSYYPCVLSSYIIRIEHDRGVSIMLNTWNPVVTPLYTRDVRYQHIRSAYACLPLHVSYAKFGSGKRRTHM